MKAKTVSASSLRDELKRRGITFEATAVLAGCETSTVSRIVNGQRRASPETVVRLARALNISPVRLRSMTEAAWMAAQTADKAPS